MICCTVLNPVIDVVYALDELKLGRTYKDVPASSEPAGKGLNVAKVVRALGERARVIGIMPEHGRRQYEERLRELDIDSTFYPVPGRVRINTTIVEQSSSESTHINSRSEQISGFDEDAFVDFVERQARQSDLWALCGSVPPGVDASLHDRTAKLLKKKKVGCLLDSSGQGFRQGIKAKPLMIKPNQAELEEYFEETIRGVRHLALRGKRFVDAGIEFVFISLGSDGMIAMHGSDCLLCSAPQVKALDTVGCGDAMVAGLLVGYKKKFSFPEMCRLAVACGASNATHQGAGNIDAGEVWRLTEDVKIEAV